MKTIFKREFLGYYRTPVGYVFMGVFLTLSSVMFYLQIMQQRSSDLLSFIGQMSYLWMLLSPVLTMRLMSEDKRARTDQLLLTAPVSRIGIVLGKYLSALLVYLIAISGTLLMTVVMSFYASPDWPVVIGNLIGLVMLGASLIAICMFLSSSKAMNRWRSAALRRACHLFLWMPWPMSFRARSSREHCIISRSTITITASPSESSIFPTFCSF